MGGWLRIKNDFKVEVRCLSKHEQPAAEDESYDYTSSTRDKLTLGNLNLGAPFWTSLAPGWEVGTLSVAVGGDMMDR